MLKGVFHNNIEELTLHNENYRKVINTNTHLQLVLMNIQPGNDIPEEIHNEHDQFFRIESGSGIAIIEDKEYELDDGTALIIPANNKHYIKNTGSEPLKLYTIYAPPEHKYDRLDTNYEAGYKNKYLKYKLKYLQLKKEQKGGAMHKIHVSQPWYSLIKNGKKTVEGRLNKGTFSQINEGDNIEFFNNELNDSFVAKVNKITKHNSFYDMIQTNGLDKVLPGIENAEKGVMVYRQYYPEELEKQFGVLAIHILI